MNIHFQTPQDIRHQIWVELGRASQDRHHAWRTPVLATVAADGLANARTVVLRDVDAATDTLQIYTDARSAKVSELVNQPNALFVFWSKRLNWQLRVRVHMTVQATGPHVDAVLQHVKQSAAAGDYLGLAAPGTSMSSVTGTSSVTSKEHHLVVLIAQVLEMDWLELARTGHRRAKLMTDAWEWLTP
jgi:pyridoxamine 5'-phosphate oxidase